jgi:hypothetical protein
MSQLIISTERNHEVIKIKTKINEEVFNDTHVNIFSKF